MKIAFLGTGNMGRALLAGVLRQCGSGVHIVAWDKNSDALKGIDPAVMVVEPSQWFEGRDLPDAVVIAVKPFDIESALAPLAAADLGRRAEPLWISIAAGKSIAALQKVLPPGSRICRVMPNTPALIAEGMSAYTLSDNARENDAEIAETILRACGKVVRVPEHYLNAVTGLSGSGPAYVFYFIESLIEAGVMAGLPLPVARECALQTVIGAARMAQSASESLPDLTMKVMTPAGTTARACSVLEQGGFKHLLIKAVCAATKRSEQLEK